MEKTNIFESKIFRAIILSISGLIILVFVFGLGVFVGAKRADFSFKWAAAYHRNFGGPQGGFLGDFMGSQFTSANGVYGQIIAISGQTLTIKEKDNIEKSVLTNNETTIIFQRKNEKLSDLKINDNIVAIGEPNGSGQIEAELIRVMPALPATQTPASGNTNTNAN